MRLKLWVVALVAAAGAFFTGCDSKKELTPKNYYSFKLDTTVYRSNATEAAISKDSVTGRQQLVVDGVTNNFLQHMELTIVFPDSVKAGKYTTGVLLTLMDIQEKQTGYYSKDQAITVNLTSINSKYAEGTFSGTLTNGEIEKPLTDGTFKVTF
ncbi:hypothetical protein [Chitinophaga vietnamensis]|uniref:hypothetical protein n=1 Tax=Chitinophaga vietnamensis TaxID=2593957 RepID=UPI001177A2EA|nr:hypothetical protein [Chitinophaga vietnamensis]